MKSNDIDSFVIGKLPPNTLLVVKRQPKSKPGESELKEISELKQIEKQIDEKVEIKADVSDPDRVLAEAQELRQATLTTSDTSSREVAAKNTASEVENKVPQDRQEKTSFDHNLSTLA